MKNRVNNFTKIAIRCLSFLALIALSFLGVFSTPLMNVAKLLADEATTTASATSFLKLLSMPSSVKLGNTVSIPRGETDDGAVNVVIKNPKGEIIYEGLNTDTTSTAEVNASGTSYVLNPTKVGTYTVEYSVASGNLLDLNTQTFKIAVTGEKAVMEFEENSKYMIPSVTNGDYQIVLPNPTVTDSEGNVVAANTVLSNLEVIVKAKNNSYTSKDVAQADYFIKSVDGHFAFTPNATEDCTYTITYIYTDSVTGLQTTEVFEVDYEKEFDATNIELGYNLSGSMPESLELGVETKLPTITTYDKNDSELDLTSYTEVEVVFDRNEGEDVTVANTNVFTPMYPTTEGTYKITYKIYDFYTYANGGEANKTLVYSINDVKDSTAPTTYAVANYAVKYDAVETTKVTGVEDNYEMKDISYTIPTRVEMGTIVDLPAIYAEDNFSNYGALYTKLKRVIVKESGSNEEVTKVYKDVNGTMQWVDGVKPNETASYEFKEAGTYTIRYEATDEAGRYNYTGLNFTVVVEEEFNDTTAPSITISGVPASSKSGSTITFVKPAAVDYKEAGSTEVIDRNLEVGYYYYLGNVANLEDELALARTSTSNKLVKIEASEEDNSKLTFVVPATTEATATVVCVAYDDAGNMNYVTRTINIVNITDNTAPTISTANSEYTVATESLKQDEIINLPSVVVADDNVKYLEGTVTVTDESGNRISVVGAKYNINETNNTLTISNARFVATKAEDYTITYTINDIGGNYIVKSYVVSVADTKAPTIEVDGTFTSVEIGQTVSMPTITVKDNGSVLKDAYYEVRFIGNNNPNYKFVEGTLEFTALEAGTFTYEFYAKDNAGNETISGPYTFTAADTKAPTIELDRDLNSDKVYDLEKDSNQKVLPITLPGFTADDQLNGVKEMKVEVYSPSEKSLTVSKATGAVNGDEYQFTPTVDGVYTVKYIAIDNANNETTQTYYIRIGDNTKPSMVIGAESSNAPSELVSGSTLKLDLTEIDVTDAGTTLTADKLTSKYTTNGYSRFVVTVTGPDGSTVKVNDGTQYEYTLDKTGKYTITYTARDEAGNERVVKKYVEVYAEEADSIFTTETWGVILIVASLAVLGGVVIYFIRTRDKKAVKKSTKDDNKKLD